MVIVLSPLHHSNSLLPQDAAGASLMPQNPAPSHPRPLSLGQEESIIPSSLITPTVARRTPHQNTFSLLRDPRGNTGGGETGEEREEGG